MCGYHRAIVSAAMLAWNFAGMTQKGLATDVLMFRESHLISTTKLPFDLM
jgi:hypothetical protein